MEPPKSSYFIFLESAEINCKPNAILGSRLVRYFTENNHTITKDISLADFIFVNGCGFNELHEIVTGKLIEAAGKKAKKGARIISVGCLNKINPEFLEKRFNNIDIVFDLSRLDDIFAQKVKFQEITHEYIDPETAQHMTENADNFLWTTSLAIRLSRWLIDRFKNSRLINPGRVHLRQIIDEMARENKFYVKIGSGCVGNCHYCIIKKAKGAPISRPIADILNDIGEGLKPGQVVNLVADDNGSYGVDISVTLFDLIYAIHEKFPDAAIDFCYINPLWLEKHTEEYLEMLGKVKINSMNISMQSGSDKVIHDMNRRYRTHNILEFIRKMKEVSPGTLIWGHFLFGYPTETWKDFWESMKASRSWHFYYSFYFSPRKGTYAAQLSNMNSMAVRKLRWFISRQLLNKRLFFGMFRRS